MEAIRSEVLFQQKLNAAHQRVGASAGGAAEKSLRLAAEKWVNTTAPTTTIRVSRLSSYQATRAPRCVRIESRISNDPVVLFFFQHPDGAWRVFPPSFVQKAA